ncbi:MAG: SDR family oxidoreductase [FCB group bacterium]|jgi:NAD(P)-dependent dehydrogenase (short-subunit alcohol dehydrogenase family)|nr:SDR family oxidoreductase [FCB group bacterium]
MPSDKEEQTTSGEQLSSQPGIEADMEQKPEFKAEERRGSGKLQGKVALITGGDSGIGRATAILFAREGADVAVAYLNEHEDANTTRQLVEQEGRRCITIPGDIGDESVCREAVQRTVNTFGRLDVLVNNAAEQHPQESITDITEEQLLQTFRTNIFSMFFTVKAALPHLKEGSTIVNVTSVTAYRGSPQLLDYSSTKGAIVAFTRSLSINLAEKKIRVNAVAPGPIWTPLIPATFPPDKVKSFGSDVPMQRPGQPEEVAPCLLFLACDDSSYISGQTLHPNGGFVING